MTMVRFNALLDPELDDDIHYFSEEEGKGRCEVLRTLAVDARKIRVMRRRKEEDPAFRRYYAKQVLKSKGE